MKAYSMDLRVRVLADGDAGLSTAEVAEKQRVSASWVRRLKQRWQETGEIAPRPSGHPPLRKLADQDERLRARVRETPDATLAEWRRDLGLEVALSTLWRRQRDLGLALKKSPASRRAGAPGRGRPARAGASRAGHLGSGAAHCFSMRPGPTRPSLVCMAEGRGASA
jgi:transposase